MPIPVSYRSALLLGCIDKLEAKFTSVGVTTDWSDYGGFPDVGKHSGCVLIEELAVSQGYNLGYQQIEFNVQFILKSALGLGSESLGDAYDAVDFLNNYLIEDLRLNGITGTYRNRTISNALVGMQPIGRPITQPRERQDQLIGFSTTLQFRWRLSDA